ncbi:hypothetical protein BDM02DRAFT_3108734 [Thelephora ganbajun]|uniref:Uncharacterized protein n=1 Tax=Thelephora ganbajun TaxID=370292 RepID=A0ACB6ZSS8_THEGA|nr:hypothetical protein BDM02DRAFT_3108734 [Thelephora ganbajun]
MSTVRLVSATVSTETSPRTTRTVTGSWDLIPTTATPEAGSSTIISGTRVSVEFPTQPPRVSTHAPHQSLQQSEADPFDNFFGVSHSSPRSSRIGGTHESRHDATLPPYHHGEDLPAYSTWDEEAGPKEPPTLAMYMFKYGFLFPIFWILGSIILCIPLRAPADWEPTKTAEERAELIAHMRQTEKKWAKRCLIALVSFIVLILVIALAIWSATRY